MIVHLYASVELYVYGHGNFVSVSLHWMGLPCTQFPPVLNSMHTPPTKWVNCFKKELFYVRVLTTILTKILI